MKHLCNLLVCVLQLYQVQLPLSKDQKVPVLLQVSLPADLALHNVDLTQCEEDMDLTT